MPPRRKKAPAEIECHICPSALGAMEQVRRELRGMHGGAVARALVILDRHLGAQPVPERKPCP